MPTFKTTSMERVLNSVTLTWSEAGEGPVFVLLHGGAGPQSMMGLAEALAAHGRVLVPTYPGFEGQPRPEAFRTPGDLAAALLEWLDRLNLSDVTVVGNSFGGWLAAELGLKKSPRVTRLVLMNAVGIAPQGKPIVDPTSVVPVERARLAFFRPEVWFRVPAPEDQERLQANQETLRVYAAEPHFMHDPTLAGRLSGLTLPTLVLWGEADGIVDGNYGKRFAEAIPGARFVVVREAGHFPQVEQRERVASVLLEFLSL